MTLVYPFSKRFFAMPQAVLGIAFSFGIPMAFAAVRGGEARSLADDRLAAVPPLAWWLLLGNLFWVLAYDTEYAMVDRDDDLRIGIKTSAITLGRFDVAGVMVFYALYLAIWAASATRSASAGAYFAGLCAAALIAAWHYTLIRDRTREGCFRAFRLNHWLGFAVFAGVALASPCASGRDDAALRPRPARQAMRQRRGRAPRPPGRSARSRSTSGGAKRTTVPCVSLVSTPSLDQRFADLRARSANAGSISTPTSRPLPRTSMIAGCVERRAAWRAGTSPRTRARSRQPVAHRAASSAASPTAAPSGLPPKVLPWSPGVNTRHHFLAGAGTRSPAAARRRAPCRGSSPSGRTPSWSQASMRPVRPRPVCTSSADHQDVVPRADLAHARAGSRPAAR